MKFTNKLFVIYLFVLFVFANFTIKANDEEIMQAMRDELKRSLSELKIESLQAPYYIEYTVKIREPYSYKATLGQFIEANVQKTATLDVDMRIGSYRFDNSNFFDVGLSFFGSTDDEERFKNRRIPIELDYSALRRELWLATDAAYKQTSEVFSKKEATLRNRMRSDTTHDFLRVQPEKNIFVSEFPRIDENNIKNLIREVSSVFRNYSSINLSTVVFEHIPEKVYYVNSEGMEYIRTDYYSAIEIVATSQTEDGMLLYEHSTNFANEIKDLPDKNTLLKNTNELAEKLTRTNKSPKLEEPYSGPILVENDAAAELWAQVFVPNLIAQRQQMTESGIQTGDRHSAFQMRIGGRVLPDFLSVYAKPEMKNFQGKELMGHFILDDNGVKPESVQLVENGYLRNLLSERIPTRRVRENLGHKRGGAAMYSNIFINSVQENIKKDSELKEKLIQLCKDRELPFAIIIKKVLNQNILFTSLYGMLGSRIQIPRGDGNLVPLEMYKIYPDGRQELIRGGYLANFTPQSFRDVIYVSEKEFVLNLLAPSVISSFMTGGDQYIRASIVSPSLLFEDAEIRVFEEDFPNPPIVPSPLTSK